MPVAKIITLILLTLLHTITATLVLVIRLVGIAQLIITKQPIKSAVWLMTLSLVYYLDNHLNVFM